MPLKELLTQYFDDTPIAQWDILELSKEILKQESKLSKGPFVAILRQELELIEQAPLIKKTAKDRAKALLKTLNKKDILTKLDHVLAGADMPDCDNSSQPQHFSENISVRANEINDSTFIGNMNVNVAANSSPSSSKKRATTTGSVKEADDADDADDDDIFKEAPPPSKRHNPLEHLMKEIPDDDVVIHEKDHAMLLAEGKTYRLYRPGYTLDSPHRPKIEAMNMNSLAEYVTIAGSSIECTDSKVNREFQSNVTEGIMNTSLKSLPGAFEFLREALLLPFEDFPKMLWQIDPTTDVKESKEIIKIMQYTLTSFHLHCLRTIEPTDHERTYFVQSIIPVFEALGQVTGLLKYNWCEKQLLASKLVYLKLNDGNQKRSTPRMMDGLGRANTAHGSMEALLFEASSGNREDHPTHSLNDTIKLLECATHSLLVEMHHCKASQYDTYAKLKVFTIQCIKDKVSMHEVSLLDHTKWKSVEKRTCQVPNSWDQRALWVKLFELVATLMISLNEAKHILETLSMESNGLLDVDGQTVGDVLYNKTGLHAA